MAVYDITPEIAAALMVGGDTWKEMSTVTRVHNSSTGANTVTIAYTDHDEYKITCTRTESESSGVKTIALTNIHEYWNNQEIFQ